MANVLHKIGTSAGPFLLTIDYGTPLDELVAAGNYDYISPDITEEHFRVGLGGRDIESFVVHLHRPTSTDNVVNEMDRHDLRPATIPELLAFGAKYPNPQREFPILALGSTWDDPQSGYRRAARILEHPSDRRLDLAWDHGVEWHQLYHFLAVQKQVCEAFPLSVDKGKSLAEMVESGHYSFVAHGIPQGTPAIAGVGVTEAILVHLGRVIDNTDVLHELVRRGLRPGRIRELAAFGEQYPDRQFHFPILALGSVLPRRRFGCLRLHDGRRAFHLNVQRKRWAANYRFLAFTTDPLRDDDNFPTHKDRRFRPFDATLEWIDVRLSSNGLPTASVNDQNGHHPPDVQNVDRALCERHYNPILNPEPLIGDDDELLEHLKSTDERGDLIPDLGKSAAMLRAEFASVAIEYTAFNFNTEGLRSANARSEALILSFLHLADFTFTHPDVYSVLADIFYLPPVRIGYPPPQQLFKQAGILELSSSTAELLKPDTATLNPHALREHQNLPFVTRRVHECLDNLEVH
jgi:hypothetical protein